MDCIQIKSKVVTFTAPTWNDKESCYNIAILETKFVSVKLRTLILTVQI